jgi:hypothetical protein
MSAARLTEDQIVAARAMYLLGRTLGEIAERLKCSVYDLSPWLYMECVSAAIPDSRSEGTNP